MNGRMLKENSFVNETDGINTDSGRNDQVQGLWGGAVWAVEEWEAQEEG